MIVFRRSEGLGDQTPIEIIRTKRKNVYNDNILNEKGFMK
jgi:hypothetical protein